MSKFTFSHCYQSILFHLQLGYGIVLQRSLCAGKLPSIQGIQSVERGESVFKTLSLNLSNTVNTQNSCHCPSITIFIFPSSPHLIPPYQHLTGWSQHLQGTQSWPISASSLTRYRHGAGYRHEQSFWPLEAHEAIAQFLRRVSSSTLITTAFPQSDLISVVATTAWSRLKVQRNPNSCVRYSTWQTFPILGRHGKSIRSGH